MRLQASFIILLIISCCSLHASLCCFSAPPPPYHPPMSSEVRNCLLKTWHARRHVQGMEILISISNVEQHRHKMIRVGLSTKTKLLKKRCVFKHLHMACLM
ncbi:hypothetical protein AMECASPLE_039558 [Ameca splendens]|uniref:Secreted protein n=1 Tax=Ameca splendens TaxID=208324 RepID=A0ABV1AEZ5_9TELE